MPRRSRRGTRGEGFGQGGRGTDRRVVVGHRGRRGGGGAGGAGSDRQRRGRDRGGGAGGPGSDRRRRGRDRGGGAGGPGYDRRRRGRDRGSGAGDGDGAGFEVSCRMSDECTDRHAGTGSVELPSISYLRKLHVCLVPMCTVALRDRDLFIDHFAEHHSDFIWKRFCGFCANLFVRNSDIKRHLNEGHVGKVPISLALSVFGPRLQTMKLSKSERAYLMKHDPVLLSLPQSSSSSSSSSSSP